MTVTRGVSHTPQTLTHYDDDDDVDDEGGHDHHDDDDDSDGEFMKGMNTPEDWHQVPFIFSIILPPSQPLPPKVQLECHCYHHDPDHEHHQDDADDDDSYPHHHGEIFPHPRTQDLTPFVTWIKIPIWFYFSGHTKIISSVTQRLFPQSHKAISSCVTHTHTTSHIHVYLLPQGP